jgi:ABC-type multidrug transport system fused ATPase/permease subunit
VVTGLPTWSSALDTSRRFTAELAAHRLRLVGVGALSLLLASLHLLRPWPIKVVFDGALVPVEGFPIASRHALALGVIGALLVALSSAWVQYVRDVSIAGVGHRVTRGIRHRIFGHLTRLSPLYHARQKSGDLLVRLMGDAPMVTTMLVDSSVELASRALLLVGTIVVMACMDPVLTVGVLVVLPPLALVARWISGRIRIAVRKQRRKEGDLADYLHEAIAATETVQSLGGAETVVRRFARDNRRSARAGLRAKRLAARLSASSEALLGCALAGALLLGSMRVGDDFTPGDLLVFLSYVRGLIKPLRSVSKHAARLAKGTACGERILAVLDEPVRVTDAPDAVPAPAAPRELRFDDVHFRYDDEVAALEGFSATFRAGELSALVGRSGAGKSTVAALASRLFDPDAGTVELDGTPLDRFTLDSLRRCVGLTLQRTAFFGASIRENLLLARPEASDEELQAALQDAGAAAFVDDQPEGLDTRLGSAGRGLSGGETSRLALARTLLRGARVLVVDEPFAGLDRAAADVVLRSLERLASERIVIVISHDLESLSSFGRIVLVERGRCVGTGTHAELSVRSNAYRGLVGAPSGLPA